MTHRGLAERTFDISSQSDFADLSGDYNPMHMDPLAARRTQAGACVVHGVHLFLWALEQLARGGLPIPRMVQAKVKFTGFVYLDRQVALHLTKSDDAGLRLQVAMGEDPVLSATLTFAECRPARQNSLPFDLPVVPLGRVPLEPEFDAMARQKGFLQTGERSAELAERLFPALARAIGVGVICDIALLSSLVGMIAPGMHSIFSELGLLLHDRHGRTPGCAYSGKLADPRFRIVQLAAEGSELSADVFAFARLPPSRPRTMAELASSVTSNEFLGRRALIIGGSRGIGAVTAKLITAGGGRVALTYAEGRLEGEAVHADILRHCGPGTSTLLRYRVGEPASAQLAALEGVAFTHVYYFATSRIFGHGKAAYKPETFAKFASIYVDGFHDLMVGLFARQQPGTITVMYPSSTAIAERPRGMTEYSMAKAAGEILCSELMRAHQGLAITSPRLPRIQTDQTETVPPVPAADPVEIMLPLLRNERR